MIREKVSGKRNRLVAGRYNLDLTYVTNAVLAMSFPASSFKQKLYRNNITDVAGYMDEYHHESYWIYNLSNRPIASDKFHGRVQDYDWEDHHSPSLKVLFQCCNHMF